MWILPVLTIVMVLAKYFNIISWSWWIVFAPAALCLLLIGCMLFVEFLLVIVFPSPYQTKYRRHSRYH